MDTNPDSTTDQPAADDVVGYIVQSSGLHIVIPLPFLQNLFSGKQVAVEGPVRRPVLLQEATRITGR